MYSGSRALEQLNESALKPRDISFTTTMAPIKRKGASAEGNPARQPQKRVRVGAEERQTDQKKQSTAPSASELTVLRDDEPSFPRGGGDVLTPLERKQIQIQATKDVLFEQKGAKGPSGNVADDDEDDEDVQMGDADDTTTADKKSRKRKTKGKKGADKDTQDKQAVRIEGLNFKVGSDLFLDHGDLELRANGTSELYQELWY